MTSAIEGARYFIELASREEEPTFLTPMQVQKLLYYAQGWHLAYEKTPLFSERFEAWTYGPVVYNVYQRYSNYGRRPISPTEHAATVNLTQAQKSFLASIWEGYKKYSPSELSRMTHAPSSPWTRVRGDLPPNENSSEEITQEIMHDFFSKQMKEAGDPYEIDPKDFERAEEDLKHGRITRLEDLPARLGYEYPVSN